ncbi:MAG TPA: hypothetical protein PLZ05_01030 [Alphaproteobacteria bacterium]|nr:hypothetical protein [Alphaproteobacteria bacterium]
MKKLVLTSFLAVLAVSAANAENINYGNPLYRPGANHFYSQTSLDMDTDYNYFKLGEEFGYGITNKLSAILKTAGSYDSSDTAIDKFSWDNMSLGLNYRYIDMGAWKADMYGSVQQSYNTHEDLETLWYNWTAGLKFGYMTSDWTVAMTAQADYLKDDVEDYNFDSWGMKLGLEGQYVMDKNWNMVAGLDYDFNLTNDIYYIDNPLVAKVGINYNMDSTKYVGIYATRDLKADSTNDLYGMGVKFGIDF